MAEQESNDQFTPSQDHPSPEPERFGEDGHLHLVSLDSPFCASCGEDVTEAHAD